MAKFTCKDPNGEPTRKQTWAVFCMTRKDIRDTKLTRQQVSDLISALKSVGVATLPDNSLIYHKDGKKEGVKFDKGVKPSGSKKNRTSWALDLIKEAEAAGEQEMKELIDSKKVRPMVVQQHANMLDDNSPVEQSWVVEGGPCGFASIRVKMVNGPSRKFINQLKKAGLAGGENSHKEWNKSSYYGGYMKFFNVGGQSLAYKTAYARGYEGVLSKAGINTWVWTKMD